MKNRKNSKELFFEIVILIAVILSIFFGICFYLSKIGHGNILAKKEDWIYNWIKNSELNNSSFYIESDNGESIGLEEDEVEELQVLLKNVKESEISKKKPKGQSVEVEKKIFFKYEEEIRLISVVNDSYVKIVLDNQYRYIKNNKLKEYLSELYNKKLFK